MEITSERPKGWTWIGLLIALFGIPAIVMLSKIGGAPSNQTILLRELAILGLTTCLLLIVTRGEGLPLSSIGMRFERPWRTLGTSVLLAFGLMVVAVVAINVLPALGIPQKPTGNPPPALPLMTLMVIRAGISEEVFYRGFALERIEKLSGSKALAIVVTLAAFAGFHFSGGLFGILVALILGALLTAYYVWKRNLIVAILAHFLVDFVPNVLLPLLGAGLD